jgi:hypothetical protein
MRPEDSNSESLGMQNDVSLWKAQASVASSPLSRQGSHVKRAISRKRSVRAATAAYSRHVLALKALPLRPYPQCCHAKSQDTGARQTPNILIEECANILRHTAAARENATLDMLP